MNKITATTISETATTAITAPTLNHLGKPFKPVAKSPAKSIYNRQLARRLWRASFGAKLVWRQSRQAGSDCSFRIFTGRCAA